MHSHARWSDGHSTRHLRADCRSRRCNRRLTNDSQCRIWYIIRIVAWSDSSGDYVKILQENRMIPSLSRPGNPYDKDYVSHCTSFVLSGMSLTSDTLRENFKPWAFFGASLPGGSYR